MGTKHIDSLDPQIRYSQGWDTEGDHKVTRVQGERATLEFVGTRIQVVGFLYDPSFHKSTYTIDNRLVYTYVNDTTQTHVRGNNVLFFTSDYIQAGQHTLIVINQGAILSLKSFQIDDITPPQQSSASMSPSIPATVSSLTLPTAFPTTPSSTSTSSPGGTLITTDPPSPSSVQASTSSFDSDVTKSSSRSLSLETTYFISRDSMSLAAAPSSIYDSGTTPALTITAMGPTLPADLSSRTKIVSPGAIAGGVATASLFCILLAAGIRWLIRRRRPTFIFLPPHPPPEVSSSLGEGYLYEPSDISEVAKSQASFTESEVSTPPYNLPGETEVVAEGDCELD